MAFTIIRHQVVNDQASTQQTPVAGTTLEIGRGSGNALLLDDLRIGLRHAVIQYIDGRYVLKDLESGSNTYVNHKPIRLQPLADGDEVNIGSYTLRLRLSSPSEPLTIEVIAEEPEAEAESATPESYLARYRLTASRFTKTRLTWWGLALVGAGVLLVLLYKQIPLGSKVWHTASILSPGDVTPPHRFIEQQCTICHADAWGAPTTAACTACHTGFAHQETQTFTPECVSCHREHRSDRRALTTIRDQLCVQCHTDLQVLAGKTPQYATHVDAFTATGHTEFAVLLKETPGSKGTRVKLSDQKALRDPSAIKLNHEIHLSAERIKKVTSKTLTCTNCHKMDAQGVGILPIDYTEHCSQCHPLEFDNRFPGQVVEHGNQPDIIQEFLKNNFFTPRCLELAGLPRPPASALPAVVRPGASAAPASGSTTPPPATPATVTQCRDEGVREAQKRLYAGGKQSVCGLCHTLQDPTPGSQLPTVVRPEIPPRWFTHAKFEHQTHVRATVAKATTEGKNPCEYCHRPDLPASKSSQTTDVLLPGIASCQTCHSAEAGVSTQCVTCHQYHARKPAKS